MHEDEEIRYVLSGSGFFDVRGAFFLKLNLETGFMCPLLTVAITDGCVYVQIILQTSGFGFTSCPAIFLSFRQASTTASRLTS
jgi:hypothetical protein